eukprot:6880625-Ditylum_brightwellii.AAC.2
MVPPQPSNKKDPAFLGKQGKLLYASDSAVAKEEDVDFMEIRYRFQKNKDNGQNIKYSKSSNIKLCPVRAGLRVRRRVQRLRVRTHTPIAMCLSSSKRKAQYIKDNHIEHVLKMIIKDLYNLALPEVIKQFSPHSIRVGACVLLHSSRKDDDFIKLRLRCKSDTFRLYLKNTTHVAGQHCQ